MFSQIWLYIEEVVASIEEWLFGPFDITNDNWEKNIVINSDIKRQEEVNQNEHDSWEEYIVIPIDAEQEEEAETLPQRTNIIH